MVCFDKVRFYNLKSLGIKKSRKVLIDVLNNSEKFQDCFSYHFRDFRITSVYVKKCSDGNFILEINCYKLTFDVDNPSSDYHFVKDTCFWFLDSNFKEMFV